MTANARKINIPSDDPYPSRCRPQADILKRLDPVVYGTGRGFLSDDRLTAFDRDGYLFFERFFEDREIAAFQDESARLFAKAANDTSETVIREPDSKEVRSIFAVHRDNALFARLAADPRLVAMAEQVLGGPVYIHQSRINFKKGYRAKEFYWHSDFETWHVEDGMPRMRAFSVSIALSENTPNNGPLMVIPGSHKHYVTCVGETPDNHYKQSLRRQDYGVPDDESLARLVEQGGIFAAAGPAGSVTMFDCNAMHGSNGNITPLPRSNVFLVYNSVANALVEPFGGQKPRPDFIASRDFAPLPSPGHGR